MGYLNRIATVAICGMFGLFFLRTVNLAVHLFYPSFKVPGFRSVHESSSASDITIHRLHWQEPFEYEAAMYVSTMDSLLPDSEQFFKNSEQVWHVGPESLSQRYPKFQTKLNVKLPESVRTANGTVTLYAFLFIQKAGYLQPHPSMDINSPIPVISRATLTSIKQRQVDRKHLLVGGDEADKAKSRDIDPVWVPHGKTRLGWELVLEDHEFFNWDFPKDIVSYIKVYPSKKLGKNKLKPYSPPMWENAIAARREHWVPLTNQSTVSSDTPLDAMSIDIDVTFTGVVLGWFRLCNVASAGLSELTSPRSLMQQTEADVDSLKEMIYEVNPTLLAITIAAMTLHLLFEFLAYKEDVSFWADKSKAKQQGISRSSMVMNAAGALIRAMYLYDRRGETNMVIIFCAAVGGVVELWKLSKVLNFKQLMDPFTNLIKGTKNRRRKQKREKRKDQLAKKGQISTREIVQQEVDQLTAWCMLHICGPLLAAYAVYSLVYRDHESYLSWFLHISLVAFYVLEFVQMWPQLLINHRLKTVEMLPLTAFMYRFLLTFIDDLYALVVPMPFLERIGTLRDDLVFFVLCYQWLKFPRVKDKAKTD